MQPLHFVRLLTIAVVMALLTACKPSAIRMSEATASGPVTVLTHMSNMPVYAHGGATVLNQQDRAATGPEWALEVPFQQALARDLRASGRSDVNVASISHEDAEAMFDWPFESPRLSEVGKARMNTLREEGRSMALIVVPMPDISMYGTARTSYSHGIAYHCVVFVACYGRAFVNLVGIFVDLQGEPEVIGSVHESHPDVSSDQVEDFDVDAFQNDPAPWWNKAKPQIEKYMRHFPQRIAEKGGYAG